MDLQTRKLELIQEFLKIEDEGVISRLELMLKNNHKSFDKESIKPMTVEELNSRIDQSMEDSLKERLIESSDLKSKINEWN